MLRRCTLGESYRRLVLRAAPDRPRPRLRPRPLGAGASLVYLSATALWLLAARPPALPWLGLAALAVAAAGLYLPGLANQISLGRAYLAGPALGLGATRALLPLALVILLAAATDLADGFAARRWEKPTRLGGALDPVVDGLLFGSAGVGLALAALYPLWLAVVVILRYLLPALGGGLLLLFGRQPVLKHTPAGQASTAAIALLLIGLAAWVALGRDARWLLLAAEVVIPLSAAAALLNLAWVNRSALSAGPVHG
ncbi:CDP-alcohol phosphatidyltransferase family protein [Candidatus Dormiibacter inghamiae]|uniref:CDP-alcohol phosphatidyltransferase family protein n=1 Tax=Candidatus Dormiibacter inghamiae TaxID=3127013 RepID=UPI0030C6D4CD